MDKEFWQRCTDNGVVIIAFKAYSQYRDGHYHEDDCIGLRYAGLSADTGGVLGDELYVSCDDAVTSGRALPDGGYVNVVAETPEEALEKFLVWQGEWGHLPTETNGAKWLEVIDAALANQSGHFETNSREIAALRAALTKIAERTGSDDPCRWMVDLARDTLRKPGEPR